MYKMSQYFSKPFEPFVGDINVKVDLSNYARKADLKNATGINTSKLPAKSYLASLKAEVDKIDVDKLKTVPDDLNNLESKANKLNIYKLAPVPVDLSKLSNGVKNGVVKEDAYNAKIKIIEDKIPDTTNLVTKTTLNAKINEVKVWTPSISNLATTIAVEDKIPNVSNLVKKNWL